MPKPWNKGLRTPLAERLFAKVEVGEADDCWPFTGEWRSRFGYGRIREGGDGSRCLQAHIAMYEMKVGPVPEDQWLLHDCDNPLCCNPGHLRPGTARGQPPRSVRARRIRTGGMLMKGAGIGTTWRSYVAEAPAWGIVLGALAVSATTQVVTVHHHGFALWEAIVWGSSTDFGTIACLFLAREGAHRGTPTWGAWVLSVACAALSVQYNVVAGVEARDWLAVEAHVWMPALALGVWYWLLHGRHRRWTAAVAVKEPAPVVQTGQQDRTADSPRDSRADSADIVSEGAFRQAVREVGIGQKELAARLGVTTRSIRRYQKRWPEAMGVAVLRSEVS